MTALDPADAAIGQGAQMRQLCRADTFENDIDLSHRFVSINAPGQMGLRATKRRLAVAGRLQLPHECLDRLLAPGAFAWCTSRRNGQAAFRGHDPKR